MRKESFLELVAQYAISFSFVILLGSREMIKVSIQSEFTGERLWSKYAVFSYEGTNFKTGYRWV